MADGSSSRPAPSPSEASALVDAQRLRSLRGAERPALPDGAQASAVLVGHVATRIDPTDAPGPAGGGAPAAAGGDVASAMLEGRAGDAAPIQDIATAGADPDAMAAGGFDDQGEPGEAAGTPARPAGTPPPAAASEATPAAPRLALPPDEAASPADGDPAPALASSGAAGGNLPAADPARLAVRDATTREDEAVALEIAASLNDLDGQGGERLEVILAGLPTGAVLSAGVRQPDGSWRLQPADLPGLMLTPPRDWSGEVTLSIRAIVTGPLGDRAETTASLRLVVEAVADAPAANPSGAGGEDTLIPLALEARTTDIDGSESITAVRIEGVPADASLTAGVRGADGTWTVQAADLAGLALVPPAHFSGAIDLVLTVEAREPNGSTATTTVPFTVTVGAIADAPVVTAGDSTGLEDTWIPLNGLGAALVDADGSESLAVSILGVPAGARLSAGSRQPDGSWQVAVSDLAGLALLPPDDFAGTIALRLRAVATEADPEALVAQAAAEAAFTVTVNAVVDGATIGGSAQGEEDSWITLAGTLGASADASETWAETLTIAGLPPGAVLNQGTDLGGGIWQVPTAEFAAGRVAIRPPADSDADFVLTVTGRLIDGEGPVPAVRDVTAALPVTVTAVADAPLLAAADVAGREDTAIRLDLSAALADLDGSETLAVTISGVPAGASLSAGSRQPDGSWVVPAAALPTLSLTPPLHFAGQIPLSITATSTEARDGSRASTAASFVVNVSPVADAGSITGRGRGSEDTWIRITATFSTPDTDGSESWGATTLVTGVPAGAVLSQGRPTGPGAWEVPTSELAAGRVAIRPPADSDADFTLSLATTLIDRVGGTTATVSILPELRSRIAANGGGGDAEVLFGTPAGSGSNWNTTSMGGIDVDGDGVMDGSVLRITNFTGNALAFDIASTGVGPMASNVWVAPRSAIFVYLPDAHPATMVTTLVAGSSTKTSETKAMGPHAFDWTEPRTTGGITDTRSITGSATITVLAVADTPDVFAADASGVEDSWIALAGLGGALRDTDGSETLSFRISGLPAGARLSAGTANPDGSWTLTPAQLATVSLKAPANFSGTLDLTLTAIATEARDGRPSASSSTQFRVSVDPVADAGVITGGGAGREDTAIAISASFITPDTDGSEAWGAVTTIAGVPAGASLTRGTEIAPGTWEVATADLIAGRVAITPPAHSDADFTLRLSTTLTDTGNGRSDTRTVTGDVAITVTAVADAPAITVADAQGLEDSWIALPGLEAALVDRDGSETLAVTISGVPDGALLSAGTPIGGGVWQLDAAQLAGLALLPPRDFSGQIRLTLSATATDNDASTATSTGRFTVTVDAVADVPTVRVAPAVGNEDTAIPLTLSARAVDLDGSESIAFFRIADVPASAVLATAHGPLAAEPDGSFLVPAGQAGSLTITPPRDSDADFTLRVSAIAREPNGSTAESAALALPVRVLAVADAPLDLAGGGQGTEDVPVPLNISARLSDTDGSERLHYVVSGVPAGMTLSAGTYSGPGRWSLTAGEAAGVALLTPRDWSGSVTLTLTAVAQEQDGGSSAVATIPITLDVAAVVDTPAVVGPSGTRWPTATGAEDSWIPLNLDPGLRDSDGSEQVIGTIIIGGLPAGAQLGYRDGTVLTPSGGSYAIPVARMGNVVVRPPADSDVAFDLSVQMTIGDAGGVQQTISGALRVDPEGRADAPNFTAADAAGSGHLSDRPEDGWIALPITLTLADTDGSETGRVILRDVPEGFVLSAGRNMGEGTWVLAPGEQHGLQIRPPAGFEGQVTLRAEALVTEREGHSLRISDPLVLSVTPAPGGGGGGGSGGGGGGGGGSGGGLPAGPAAPDLVVTLADGAEDTPLGLAITASPGGGGVGTVTLTYVVEGLPAGARLSAGFLDEPTGRWLLSAAELAGLQLIPPPHRHGPIDVRVSAIATDAIGQTARTVRTDTALLEAVADAPQLGAAPALGIEDQPLALNLSAGLIDRDGSESVTAVRISNLPAGARLVGPGITDNGDGSFSVDPAQLGAVQLLPPPNAHGTFSLTFQATVTEASNGSTRTESRTVGFTVAADPDAPMVAALDATGAEDSRIPLQLSAALADTDGSEVLSVVISGLPAGAILSAGINNGNGSWTLLPGQLAGLGITPPRDFSGTIAATLTAHAMERSTGAVASTATPFTITVTPVADTPIIAATERVSGNEDTALPLVLQARLTDTDGSESLSVIASDVPAGGRFTAGTPNPDGTWTFAAADLPGLAFIPPEHFSGQLTLRFTAVATESDGTVAMASQTVTFAVAAVADAPLLSGSPASGAEDSPVPLSISAALADADGSESLTGIVIGGLPPGASLSAGIRQADGSWLLTPAQLSGLALLPAANWAGQALLSVTATAREASTGQEASTHLALPVTVAAVADAPLLSVAPAAGLEDTPIALSISVGLADTDGSETLQPVVISGLPAGFTLSAGHDNGDGSFTVPVADLPGLMLLAPANWNGTLTLSATATATEADGGSASRSLPIAVTVAAVNDAPELSLAAADAVTAGAASAAAVGAVASSDIDGDPVAGATVVLGAGRQPGDAILVQGHALNVVGGRTMIGDTGIELVGGGFDAAAGQLVLAGEAPHAVYQSVLASLVLANGGGVLEAGVRSVAITLRDPAGATDTETVAVTVTPSVLQGDGTDRTLVGTAASDTFHGSRGDETMQGGAGNDLFMLAIDGGRDVIDGGAGQDTIALSGVVGGPSAGPPGPSGWQLVLDPSAPPPTAGANSLDFSEPVSGQIVMGDGTQVDFVGIERITW